MKSKKTLAKLTFILVVMAVLSSVPVAGIAQDFLPDKIEEIVQAEAKFDLFSGTVLVAKDGKIIYAKGYGFANKDYHLPNTLDTKFNISSVQKTFIATLIMQLHQEDIINLDDPLTKYYPECLWKTGNQIRIKHLLNHTSGLGDYRDNDEYQKFSESYTCIDDVMPLVFKTEPAFEPGVRPRYSNAGVLLLKGIIEKTTGKKLKDVLQERIWNPLDMKNTSLFIGGDVLEGRATAYRLAGNGATFKRIMGEPSAYAGGGIYTTVLDLLKFDQALYGEVILSEEAKSIMFTPVAESPNYAYGWEVAELGGTSVIYHGGGSGGFNSTFRRYPEKGITQIVLSNYQGAAYELANKIDRMFLDLPYSIATESDRHYKLGMHFQDQEFYAKAIEQFEKNINGESPHMPSLYQAARTRIVGEFEQKIAIKLLDRYIELADKTSRPSIAAAWWRKGVVYEQLGDIKQAIICHEKCLELDSGFEDAFEALERLKLRD